MLELDSPEKACKTVCVALEVYRGTSFGKVDPGHQWRLPEAISMHRGGCVAFGLIRWITVHTSAWVLWGGIVHALQRDLLGDSFWKKKCMPVPVLEEREVQECWNSIAAAQVSVHHLSFGFQVQRVPLDKAEPLVLSYRGIWIFHNPALERLLAGHLAGWHHIRAQLTSPGFSGVISVGCGWSFLPLTSSQQGLAQPAALFSNSYLARFATSRQACSEKSLTGMGLICIQNALGVA